VTAPGTSTDPNAESPTPVIPGGDSPEPEGPNALPQESAGCSVGGADGSSGSGVLFLLVAGAIVAMRRGKGDKAEKDGTSSASPKRGPHQGEDA